MRNMTLAGLSRTDHCKHTTYRGDGSGRDNYVIINDGGLVSPTRTYQGMSERNDYMSKTNYFHNAPAPTAKLPTTLYYPPDGSGRDSYVIFSDKHSRASSKRSGINFYDCDYLRGSDGAPSETPRMDAMMVEKHSPNMRTFINWPSRSQSRQRKINAVR